LTSRAFCICLLLGLGLPYFAFSQAFNASSSESARLTVPGSWTYASDTAYAPEIIETPKPWRTAGSLTAFYPEWNLSYGSAVKNENHVGLLFEGIACPIPAMASILPVGGLGSVELLGFPSGAWWGPQAGSDAVQFCAPLPADEMKKPVTTDSWASNRDLGLGLDWTGTQAAFRGAWDRRDEDVLGWDHDLSGAASAEVSLGGPWSLGGSALHESAENAEWNLARGALGLNSGNFQDVKITPYAQQSRWDSLSVREGGVQVDQHFDMAGVMETQCGIGGASRDWKNGDDQGSVQYGYMRCGFFADLLGMAHLDATGRWDGAQRSHASPSVMGGIHVPQGPFTFEAALHRSSRSGEMPDQILSDGRVSENSFGIQARLWMHTAVSLRFFHRTDGALRFDAWEPKASWIDRRLALKVLKEVRLEGSALCPKNLDAGGEIPRGLVGRLEVVFNGGWSLYSALRLENRQRGSACSGIRIPLRASAFLVEIENWGGQNASWPDESLEPGRLARVSWEAAF
jgi:hypothetical protein